MRSWSALILAVIGLIAGCSSTTAGTGSKASATTLVGSYRFVQDVAGKRIKPPATVTLTLKAGGTLTVVAKDPTQTLTDTGTWRVTGETITIAFVQQGIKGTGRYSLDGTTLRLPVLLFGSGPGVSEWTRVGAAPSGPPSPSTSSSTSTPPPAGDVTWDDHGAYDASNDAAAAGMKAYVEALDAGASRTDAVQQAVAKGRAVADVQSADVSPNGLNVTFTYTDGRTELMPTERLQPQAPANKAVASDPATCDTLPAVGATPDEPGREGINPGGGYGVQQYLPTVRQKPITSADTPSSKRALIIAPQYDVTHDIDHSLTTIRAVTGNDAECISAILQKRGYTVDTILGKDGANRSQVGELAVADLVKDLTTHTYGVIYYVGHGWLTKDLSDFIGIVAGEVDLTRPDIQAVLQGKPIDKTNYEKVEEAFTTSVGLSWDPANKAIALAPSGINRASMAIKKGFFEQMRAKGADFSRTLVYINGCSSAATLTFAQAIQPRAYIGWKQEMDGTFVADAAEQIFDTLGDTAKSLRFATQVWQLHENWKLSGPDPDPMVDYRNLGAYGVGLRPYAPLSAQSYILIFAIRNGPSTATANLATNATFVQKCYDEVWKLHKSALASPSCHALQFGNHDPTESELLDALDEVGASHKLATGRWTLAD